MVKESWKPGCIFEKALSETMLEGGEQAWLRSRGGGVEGVLLGLCFRLLAAEETTFSVGLQRDRNRDVDRPQPQG